MKVKADVTIEIDDKDFTNIDAELGEELIAHMTDEVLVALKGSEAYRDLRKIIYNACLERIRGDIAREYVEKVEGKS